MKRKFLILICLILFIVSAAAVSAAEADTNQTDDLELYLDNNPEDNIEEVDLGNEIRETGDSDVLAASDEDKLVGKDIAVENFTFNAIQTAVDSAEAGDTIYLMEGTYINDGNGQITISKNNIFIVGVKDSTILDAQKTSRIFNITATSGITIKDIVFMNGNADNGGAIYVGNAIENFDIDAAFINNTVTWYGGANYFNGFVLNSVVSGSYINNNAAEYGGVNYFKYDVLYLNVSGIYCGNIAGSGGGVNRFAGAFSKSAISGTYINNRATDRGGANIFSDVLNSNISGTYDNNTAYNGGANFFQGSVSDSNICGAYSNNNVTRRGGANYFNREVSNITVSGTYTNNRAREDYGGANFFQNLVSGSAVLGTYINNTAGYGGANYFFGTFSDSNISGTYSNNTATKGGANYFGFIFSGSNISGTYNHNDADNDGGANYFLDAVSDSNISGDYINNTASDYGGANCFNNAVSGSNISGTYINNTAKESGGAIYFNALDNVNITGDFINNTAKTSYNNGGGGAIAFSQTLNNVSISGNFIGNKVSSTSSGHGGAAFYFFDEINNVEITGNFINNSGRNLIIINWAVNGTEIHDSVFMNNAVNTIFLALGNFEANNNWFGNNATNYNERPENVGIDLTNWLFLNATADPGEINVGNSSKITFVLQSYNGTSGIVPNINLTLSQTLGELDKAYASLGEEITYTAKDVGNATVTGKFETASYAIRLTNDKFPTSINIAKDSINLTVLNSAAVGATLTPGEAGNLTYASSNSSVAVVVNDAILAVGKGTAVITVSFAGNEYYAASSKNITVNVSLNDASVSVNNKTVNLFVDDKFTIVPVTYPKGLDVTYIPDDSGVITIDENNTVTALKGGIGVIIVRVGGDGVYKLNTTSVTFNVTRLPCEITVATPTLDLKALDEFAAGATLIPNAGNLTYTTSNSSVAIVENGTIKAVGAGNATITVSFAGNDKYAAAENRTINVTVSLNDVVIAVNNGTVVLKVDEKFTLNVTTSPEGLNVSFIPDESGVFSVDENGTVTALNVGIGKLMVKFAGNNVYAEKSVTVTVKVAPNKIVISPDVAFNFTDPEVIAVNLPEDATGYVLLDIDGTQSHVPLACGKANLTIPKLAEGTYNATVTYLGDDWFESITVTKEINVSSNVPESALSIPDSAKSDAPTTYSISLPGNAEGFLEVDVDGTEYLAALINGSASITVPALAAGNHNVAVKYTGDENYSPVSKKTTLNVTDPVLNLSQNLDVGSLYSAKAVYKVLVTRDGKAVGAGEAVTFKFNGKTYAVKTDSKGYATLNIDTNVKPKTYDITAEYKGVKVSNKVTVKNIIKAQNKKVKKSKKVTKVKISLNKVDGKYLKGKVLKIKFKGKTYKVKTNKKGTATWKVKKSMLKKLKAGKKYKYTVTYGNDVVTKKLTVKK